MASSQEKLPQNIDPKVPSESPAWPEARSSSSLFCGLLLTASLVSLALEIFRPGWAKFLFKPMEVTSFAGLSATAFALVPAIVLHEFGHFVASLCMRFEILGLT